VSKTRGNDVNYNSQYLMKVVLLWVPIAFGVSCLAFATTPDNVNFDKPVWSSTWFCAVMSPLWAFLVVSAGVWLFRLINGWSDDMCYTSGMFRRTGWLWVVLASVAAVITFNALPSESSINKLWMACLCWCIYFSTYFAMLSFSEIAAVVDAKRRS